MPFLMITAAVSVFVMVMITVCSGGYQFTFQISFHCLIRIAFRSGAQFNPCFSKRCLRSAADAAADQHIHRLFRQKTCQGPMSHTIGSDYFTGDYFIVLNLIYFKKLGSSKMLKYISIIISYSYFHFYLSCFLYIIYLTLSLFQI